MNFDGLDGFSNGPRLLMKFSDGSWRWKTWNTRRDRTGCLVLLCSWISLCSGSRDEVARYLEFLGGKKKIEIFILITTPGPSGRPSFAALLRFFGVLDWKALFLRALLAIAGRRWKMRTRKAYEMTCGLVLGMRILQCLHPVDGTVTC